MALHDENVVWHAHAVTREDREVLHGHKGAVVWFTGLSGSGKSTVAGRWKRCCIGWASALAAGWRQRAPWPVQRSGF